MSTIEYIAVGPFSWGKGATIKQAKSRMHLNVPGWIERGYSYKVFETQGDCEVSEIDGGISYPKDRPAPKVVEERKRKEVAQ